MGFWHLVFGIWGGGDGSVASATVVFGVIARSIPRVASVDLQRQASARSLTRNITAYPK